MSAPTRPRVRRLRAALALIVAPTLVPATAAAQIAGGLTTTAGTVAPVPVFVYPGWSAGCGLYGNCIWVGSTARSLRDRRDEVMRQREDLATPRPPPNLWSSESQWGYARRLPPPTPESEIQPQFRSSGEILPQFRDSGTR